MSSNTTSVTRSAGPGAKAVKGVSTWVDERVAPAKFLRKNLAKVFPDHWSFMLGEIALYSFIILLLSGTFLALFFKPSMVEVVYEGSYIPLRGSSMSEAYASALEISFEVRGGLLMRQVHHWAALLFLSAMAVHMLRIFFTGAFRRPREINWVIGVLLFLMGFLNGFTGYSVVDDLLSGTGLRIAQGIMLSIPVVGTYISFLVFGGEYPGDDIVARLYTVHILLVPGVILALITVHLMLVFYQKHTQFPGAGRTDKNVVGYPFFPVYTAKAGGFFFIVFGVTTLLAGLVQINPIWLYGPYDPAIVSAGTQPDWYVGWLDGALRIFPGVETRIFGFTLPWNVIFPGLVMMGAFYTLAALYPFLEQWVTGDKREHHVLDRPRNAPTRTAIGTAVMAFYGILWLAAANDVIADWFELSSAQLTRTFRLTVIVVPVLVFVLTRRICVGLQRRDRDRVLHGRETGIIKRLPHGEFMEVHEPISEREIYELTQHDQYAPLPALPASDHNGVAARSSIGSRARVRLSGWYYGTQIPKPTRAEVEAAWAHHGGLDGATHEAEIEHEERAAAEIEAADQGELGTRR